MPNQNPKASLEPEPAGGRSRVSKALLYGGLFAYLAAWAGVYANESRGFMLAAVVILVLASFVAALGLGLELRNHHWKKGGYNAIACILIFVALGLAAPITLKEISRFQSEAASRVWHPPQLPEDCNVVHLSIGRIEDGNQQAWVLTNRVLFKPSPDYHPLFVDGPFPLEPVIEHGCLYVKVRTLLDTNETTVSMSTDWDMKIPPRWDRNYNSNSFEIVNEQRFPVFRLRYRRANVVEVEGILMNDHDVFVCFGDGYSGYLWPRKTPIPIPQEKPWFKYPAAEYPGVPAGD